ncbi:hypothetical protein E2320_003519, partial [Naja naja]
MGNHTSYEEFILLGFLIGRKAEIFLAIILMVVIINPFLSPFVYTLRNDLVKTILQKLFDWAQTFMVQKAEKFFIIVV